MSILNNRNTFNVNDNSFFEDIYTDNIYPNYQDAINIARSNFLTNVDVQGVLQIHSSVSVDRNLFVSGSSVFESTLTLKGDSITSVSLVVSGMAIFNSNLIIHKNFIVSGSTIVNSSLIVAQNLTVSGTALIQSNLSVLGNSVQIGDDNRDFGGNILLKGYGNDPYYDINIGMDPINYGFEIRAPNSSNRKILTYVDDDDRRIKISNGLMTFWGIENKIGVNTANPAYLFDVNGTTRSNEIITSSLEGDGTLNIGCNSGTNAVDIGCSSTVQTVNIGKNGGGATTINIGGIGDTVNIMGSLVYVDTTNLQVTDNNIILNKGGNSTTSPSAGISIEESGNSSSGYLRLNANRDGWVIKAPTSTEGKVVEEKNYRIQFNALVAVNRKFVLWNQVDNDHQFFGFGFDGGSNLRYQVSGVNQNHVFFRGNGSTTSTELMRITGGGNVGIGTASPNDRLTVNGTSSMTGLKVGGIGTINGATNIANTLNVSGAVVHSSTVVNIGTTTNVGNVVNSGTLTSIGATTLSGATNIANTLNVSGDVVNSSTVVNIGNVVNSGTLTTAGIASFTSTVLVNNVGIKNNNPLYDLDINGVVNASNYRVSGTQISDIFATNSYVNSQLITKASLLDYNIFNNFQVISTSSLSVGDYNLLSLRYPDDYGDNTFMTISVPNRTSRSSGLIKLLCDTVGIKIKNNLLITSSYTDALQIRENGTPLSSIYATSSQLTTRLEKNNTFSGNIYGVGWGGSALILSNTSTSIEDITNLQINYKDDIGATRYFLISTPNYKSMATNPVQISCDNPINLNTSYYVNAPEYRENGTSLSSIYDKILTFNGPLSRNVNTISIPQASSIVNGYLSSGDWTTFNSKENVLTFNTPLIRSTNSISIQVANSSSTGCLSSTDWNTFNGKESVLTFSTPLTRSANNISIPLASSSANGYLSSTDWSTFYNDRLAKRYTYNSFTHLVDWVADPTTNQLGLYVYNNNNTTAGNHKMTGIMYRSASGTNKYLWTQAPNKIDNSFIEIYSSQDPVKINSALTINLGGTVDVARTTSVNTDPILRVRHSNLTQGIGIGWNTIVAVGSNIDQDIEIRPKGSGITNVVSNCNITGLLNANTTTTSWGGFTSRFSVSGSSVNEWGAVFNDSNSATARYISFRKNTTEIGSISFNTSSVSYNTTSDYRLKENITPYNDAINEIMRLKPVRYTWKNSGEKTQGFIAHELQEVFPEAVSGEKDATNPDGTVDPQGIDSSKIIAPLVSSVQHHQNELEALKARINKLEQLLSSLYSI